MHKGFRKKWLSTWRWQRSAWITWVWKRIHFLYTCRLFYLCCNFCTVVNTVQLLEFTFNLQCCNINFPYSALHLNCHILQIATCAAESETTKQLLETKDQPSITRRYSAMIRDTVSSITNRSKPTVAAVRPPSWATPVRTTQRLEPPSPTAPLPRTTPNITNSAGTFMFIALIIFLFME